MEASQGFFEGGEEVGARLDEQDVFGVLADFPLPAVEGPGRGRDRDAGCQAFLQQRPGDLKTLGLVRDRGQGQQKFAHGWRKTWAKTLASPSILSMTQYSFGWWSVSSSFDQQAASNPARRNRAATVPPPIPLARPVTP